jgi:hypothetical protein
VHPNVTASVLTLVGAEAVERIAQGRDMKAIADQDEFPIDGYDGRASTKNWGKQVVPHVDAAAGGRLI